jgi:probable O-glycosylation ligase (exosortase A-associated)
MKGLLFTYLLTYGGALAALFNPFHGLLVYVCFAIVRPDKMWFWSVPEGNYSRIVGIGLLLGWLAHGCGSWRFGRAGAAVTALLGYLLWSMLSALQADDQAVAWQFVESIAKIVLPCLVGICTIDSVRKLKQLAWVIALSQGYVAFELNLSYLDGYNRVLEEGFGGMDNNCVAIAMVTGVGLSLFLALSVENWGLKGVAAVAALLMAHVILFSFSRGGMLALLVTGCVGFLLLPKQPRHYLLFAGFVAVAVYLAGPQVQARFSTIFADSSQLDASARSRLDLWANCLDVISKYPLLGVGPDHWQLVAHEYGWPRGKLAHSLWLQIAAELGIVGVSFLLIYYLSCIKRLWGQARHPSPDLDPWLAHAARMVIAALVGFTVSAQFVSLDRLEIPYYVALIGAGVLKLSSVPSDAAEQAAMPQQWHEVASV